MSEVNPMTDEDRMCNLSNKVVDLFKDESIETALNVLSNNLGLLFYASSSQIENQAINIINFNRRVDSVMEMLRRSLAEPHKVKIYTLKMKD